MKTTIVKWAGAIAGAGLVLSSFHYATASADTMNEWVCSYAWKSDLSIGASSYDIYALQRVLNLDPATQVAATGPGSPGMETGYFGALTQDAVRRFQEKYANEVLFPAHLFSPTGYVGTRTRSMLNTLCAG